MRKFFSSSLIVCILAISFGVFGVAHLAHAQLVPAGATPAINFVAKQAVAAENSGSNFIQDLALTVPGWIASYIVLPLAGWITTLAGLLLNFVVNETVVGMADKLSTCAPGVATCSGIGDVINATWTTVRDVTNMLFIFALLYTAIMTIFGQGNYKRTILNLIIAAILINFSLFFTKVVIDFGNLVALLFYHAIVGTTLPGSSAFDTGISNALMDQLHITSIWQSTTVLSGTRLVTIGVMGTAFALIAAFVFLAVSVMFVIRFVVLIFVLILSPLMFLGLILPGQKGVTRQWLDALVGQTFFAPIYFFMTWIVVQLGQGLYKTLSIPAGASTADAIAGSYGASGQLTTQVGTFGIILNFVMMIAFLILSLTISKKYADKSGSLVSGATKWATGAAIGTTSRFGRATIGRAGAALGDNDKLKDTAANGNLVTSRLARLSLAAGRKTSESSFDARGSGLGKSLGAGNAPKGGFAKDNKDRVERNKKFADALKPADYIVGDAERELETAKNQDVNHPEMKRAWESEKQKLDKEASGMQKNLDAAVARGADLGTITALRNNVANAKRRRADIDQIKDYKDSRTKKAQEAVDKLKGVDETEAKKRVQKARGLTDAQMKDAAKNDSAVQAEIKTAQQQSVGALRKEAYANDLATAGPISTDRVFFIGKIKRSNRQGAVEIRKSNKTKGPADQITEAIKKQVEEESGGSAGTAPTTPTTPSTGATPPSGGTPPTP